MSLLIKLISAMLMLGLPFLLAFKKGGEDEKDAGLLVKGEAVTKEGVKQVFAMPIPKTLKFFPKKVDFSTVDSSQLADAGQIKSRQGFLVKGNGLQPVILSKSEFVPNEMVEHLMRNKRDSALGAKYQKGTAITNMEGAMHTFLTPICSILMLGDYHYAGGHGILPTKGARPVILSAAVHPDFEKGGEDEVIMKLVEIQDEQLVGKPLPPHFEVLRNRVKDLHAFEKCLPDYEKELQRHMVYHLMASHQLPSKKEVKILTIRQAVEVIEQLIGQKGDVSPHLYSLAVNVNGHILSLEALYHFYIHQIRNEFSFFENALSQGYVYTIDPPSIFACQIGVSNVSLLNRLQTLALREIHENTPFQHLKMVGFCDYQDKNAVSFLQKALGENVSVLSKEALFENKGHYSVKDHYALILHNNSDAFGQNIETEGDSSMDGVIGNHSDAALQLSRSRLDLMDYIF